MTARRVGILAGLLLLWATAAWAEVELDANGDGKVDDLLLPATITRDSELSAGLAGKQNALGYTPENAANKGAANGYAGLGADGKVPGSQLPESTGIDDQTASEVPAAAWSSYTGTNVQALLQEVDTALRALIGGASMPTWMPSVGPTNGRQILQATGGCTLSAYDNQDDCETNSGTWNTPVYQHTSIISGLINDGGTATDDLLSASEIAARIAAAAATKQNALGYTPENAANKGAANGYAGLGSDGKVPTGQLPVLGAIFAGTVELNTSTVANAGVIASGASQLLATHITATGVLAASDGVDWYFVGDPVAKTGFVPGTAGMLTLWPYVDADGYLQVRIANNTASAITLGTAGNGVTIKLVVRR